jgi:hypothetical protein
MSTLDKSLSASELVTPVVVRGSWWDRIDRAAERLGEWLNPILVKEARQALKGKQFSITFGLVLTCGWIWSMLGVAFIGPEIYYSPSGQDMFLGYYMILAFPLLVIVPFWAFRSLASEVEDGTFELLSITTLRPRQVVGGKLASAVLQMLVYLSAMAPCLGFTYMLRGIDFPTILYVLFYTFLASLGLALSGLALATVTSEKHWQVVLSVFLIVVLLLAFWAACGLVISAISELGVMFQEAYFWIGNLAFLTGYWSYFALFYCLASGQLTFASENRSTPLRIVMLMQQALFLGWVLWGAVEFPDGFWFWVLMFLTFSGIHWYVMGAFMTGEWSELSARVKRNLPQSFLARSFLTWLNPGPGTGYLFALTNLAGVVALTLLLTAYGLMWLPNIPSWPGTDWGTCAAFAVLGLSYVAIYLGLGRLLIAALRRWVRVGVVLAALLHVLLLAAGCVLPMMVHLMVADWRDDYALIEITNPIWTLIAVASEGLGSDPILGFDQLSALLFVLPALGMVAFLISLPWIAAEVRQVRVAKPQRVAEEDAEAEARLHPPQPVHISPWD